MIKRIYEWEELDPNGTGTGTWNALCSSTTLSTIIAGSTDRLWKSVNSGASWTEERPAGDADKWWITASCSSDASVILAGVYYGRLYLYKSSTWNEVQPGLPMDLGWNTSCCDSDGSVLLAGILGGRLYKSIDSGVTWPEQTPAGELNKNWNTLACNSDGSVILAGENGGRLYKYSSSTWNEVQPAGNIDNLWKCTYCNSDGTVLIAGSLDAAPYQGRLYIYKNSTWSQVYPAGDVSIDWFDVRGSSDGTHIIVCGFDYEHNWGRVYISDDTGNTWAETYPIGDQINSWRTCYSNAGGTGFLAGSNDLFILEEGLGFIPTINLVSYATPVLPIQVKYGLLYNWFVVDDARNIANTGWHVTSRAEYQTLITYLGTNAGGKLKETGLTYWDDPNEGATNSTNFNARGAGDRAGSMFELFNVGISIWSTTALDTALKYCLCILNFSGEAYDYTSDKTVGQSIRLIKDSTTLSDGEEGTYVGNDSKVYRTICIGTQEWLADNLCETKYFNGDTIPEVTDGSAWAALATGAMCAYDNDWDNVL